MVLGFDYEEFVKVINLNEMYIPEKYSNFPIQFIKAELPKKRYSPIALVRYSVQGIERPKGIRLDLDKSAFIDRPFIDDDRLDSFFQEIAPRVSAYITRSLFASERSCSDYLY